MILVTVGAQMTFDRLVQAVDAWAADNPGEEVFAQIGPRGWRPVHVPFKEFLDPLEFRRLVEKARVVVAHAGMGTILTALELGRPLLIMPRRGDLQETRNDHQIATARQLASLGRATVAYDAKHLIAELSHMARFAAPRQISDRASASLLSGLRKFVLDGIMPTAGSLAEVETRSGESVPSCNGIGTSAGLTRSRSTRRHPSAPDEIGACVLLAGGTGAVSLARAAERSVLELPVEPGRSLMSLWRESFEGAFSHRTPDHPAEVRILGGPLISFDDLRSSGLLTIEHDHDPAELRGTGGLLHDLAAEYSDDTYLMVAGASTLLLNPLADLLEELRQTKADVALFVQQDGSSPNIMLVRVSCLRCIPRVGFVDFKEQALPRIAAGNSVAVIRRNRPVAAVARTPAEYIRALRQYHELQRAKSLLGDYRYGVLRPFAETWQAVFSIVEDNAEVEAGANIADSVVLRGARVGRGADVVRSVVCPGAVVPPFATVVDEVVRPQNAKAIARAIGAGR